jgi:hypothetical protein
MDFFDWTQSILRPLDCSHTCKAFFGKANRRRNILRSIKDLDSLGEANCFPDSCGWGLMMVHYIKLHQA